MPTAEILSQGDEVVSGQTVDTNAAWLAAQLTLMGFTVRSHYSVPDELPLIEQAFRDAAGRSNVCICTGGLGPTQDDLTAQAVAQAFALPLELSTEALAQIQARYRSFGRTMPQVNRKQALLPHGSLLLENHWGTAPAFALQRGNTWFICLPGVPHEMRSLFHEHVQPLLTSELPVQPGLLVTLRTFGLGESNLQERLAGVDVRPAVLGFRALTAEVQVKLRFPGGVSNARRHEVVTQVAERLGRCVFGIEGHGDGPQGSLAQVVGHYLTAAGQSLATAESCTGGQLAAAVTAVPGASTWFHQGLITYTNAAKTQLLHVPQALIEQHGAVSQEVAIAMAQGARELAHTTWALATTGIAGPGGGSPEKPVGLVHIALAGPAGTQHRALRLAGARDRIQALATASALDLLRRTFTTTSPSTGVLHGQEDQ